MLEIDIACPGRSSTEMQSSTPPSLVVVSLPTSKVVPLPLTSIDVLDELLLALQACKPGLDAIDVLRVPGSVWPSSD